MRQNGHTRGSLVLLPPPRGALPGPGQRRAGCRGGTRRQTTAKLLPRPPHRPAGPGWASTAPGEEQTAEPNPLRTGVALLRSLGPWGCRLPLRTHGQFGVGMSFSERGDKKHLQPRTGQSLAVFGDRAGHTESCQLTPPARRDGTELCLALSQAAVLVTAED